MINLIVGTIGEPDLGGAITVVTKGGVGYRVVVPDRDHRALVQRGQGATVTVYARTVVNETSITIIGFQTLSDRNAYDRLVALDKVGPVTALRVISTITGDELREIVANGDKKALPKIHGLGAKTRDLIMEKYRAFV